MKIYDITVPISQSMPVWPGDPPVKIRQMASISNGDEANVSQIRMSVHTGTHIDAPKHFIDSGKTISEIALEKLTGDVLVINIDDSIAAISDQVLESHVDKMALKTSTKVLFKTRNSAFWHTKKQDLTTDYTGIDSSGAQYLSKLELDLIGVDYLSIAAYDQTTKPHQILLSSEIVLLEGINLSGVPAGVYQLYCLPLNITGCDGAPARVILIDHN